MSCESIELLISPCSSNASSPVILQTPRLSAELLDVDEEPFSRSFSDLLDMYGDHNGSERIDDDEQPLLVYGLERSIIITPAKARRLHIPPKSNFHRQSEVYQLNFTRDLERYPNIHDTTPEWGADVDTLDLGRAHPVPRGEPFTCPSVLSPFLRPPLDMCDASSPATPSPVDRGALVHVESMADLSTVQDLGEGGAARVVLVRHVASKRLLALKKSARAREGVVGHARAEVAALRVVMGSGAPFLSQMLFTFEDDEFVHLGLEFCPGGDLLTHLCRLGSFPPLLARFYASEMSSALSYLHGAGIVHRDIKPENILLDREGHVILSDFGCAKLLSDTPGGDGAASWRQRTSSNCGTLQYQAPEMILGWTHDTGVDIWGLGVVLYMMLAGKHPFLSSSGEAAIARMQKTVVSPEQLNPFYIVNEPDAEDLINFCLKRNPAHRATIKDVCGHPYFAALDWDRVAAKDYPIPWTPDLHGSMDLRYFDTPQTDFIRTSPNDAREAENTCSSFGNVLSPPQPRALPFTQIKSPSSPTHTRPHSPGSRVQERFDCSSVIMGLVADVPQPVPEEDVTDCRAYISPLRVSSWPVPSCDDNEDNPFIQRSAPPSHLAPSPLFDEDELDFLQSTPCREHPRPGLRASTMINSGPAPKPSPPALRSQRSVKFASGLSRLPIASTPRQTRFRPSPPPRHSKRSVFTPITSTVKRGISSRLPQKPLWTTEALAPALPELPAGIRRIGQSIGHTPAKNTRRHAIRVPTLVIDSQASTGLLNRLRTMRWKKSFENPSTPRMWDSSSERSEIDDLSLGFGAPGP